MEVSREEVAANSVDFQLSTSYLLLSQHWGEIDQDQADGG